MGQAAALDKLTAGAGLFWNPGAISYLSQLLLALILTGYLARRVLEERRLGRASGPTLLFGLTIGLLVPALLVSLLHAMAGGGWSSYLMPWLSPRSPEVLAMPWVPVFGGGAAAAFVQFAYRFPRRLPGTQRESMVAGAIMAALVVLELAIALRTGAAALAGEAWFRPDWFAGWFNAGMVWAAVLFLRQLLHAQRPLTGVPAGLPGRGRAVLRAITGPAASREATAARGLLVFAALPVAHTSALVLQHEGLLGQYSMDVLICWSVLAQLTGFALVYLGYLPERSSFQFKLTTISVALLLAAMNGACWAIAPGYFSAFEPPASPMPGDAYRYTPAGPDRYAPARIDLAFAPEGGAAIGGEGARVPLPFALPYFGRSYRAVHIGADGTIGMERVPHPIDVVFSYGRQPAIYPVLVAMPAQGGSVTARVEPGRLVVTRRDRCPPGAQAPCLAIQTVLHSDGRIDLVYQSVPRGPGYQLFEPLAAPWLFGFTPGSAAPGAVPPGAMLFDNYRAFMAYLDRLYAPLAGFMIGATIAVLLGMPLLFRSFLVRPLERLLHAMRHFRDGQLDAQAPVTFNDEIGYLTESFNAMARSQHQMVHGLEAMVAERVAEVTDIAARNAQLEERNRLSADLHDSVSQTLFSAALLADTLPEQWRSDPDACAAAVDRIRDLHRHALHEMRDLLTELRAGQAGERPLDERLTAQVAEFAAATGLAVAADIADDDSLPAEVQAAFARVSQECLVNVARHARAARLDFGFEAIGGQALLRIADDGRGFDPDAHHAGHFGLEIMRQRAQRAGAALEIASAPGRGTAITLIWPAAGA
ncbi:histidine kinase [Sphingomonas canadensis]|uniref:histidine kinase n=1 Tax=Sphingomonas canadensis TaxID=1219257 RepID=A0ABW3H2Q3_9SPHN|nr:sensor histidine kinase [Sphingomonas canadensis]MCW3834673.1 sensor histidine kinase [Sphingomonas canadensis]